MVIIEYLLSKDGQKQNLKAGRNGAAVQSATVEADHPRYEEAVDLVSISADGKASIELTSSCAGDFGLNPSVRPTWPSVWSETADELVERPDLYPRRWAYQPTIEQLLDEEIERRQRVDQWLSAESAAAEKKHEARVAELLRAGAEAMANDPPLFSGCSFREKSRIKEDPRIVDLFAEAEHIKAQREQKKESEKQARIQACQRERDSWIEKHGSEHLRRLLAEEIECEKIYRRERLELERPGWVWAAGSNIDEYEDPSNPPKEALALLDEARKLEPQAELRYAMVDHSCNEDCAFEVCPQYDWTGYIAVARFLGRNIEFVGPDQAHILA